MVTINLIGADGERRPVNSLLDTGFTCSLMLPPETLQGLGFAYLGQRYATLANGQTTPFNTYLGKVEWHGQENVFAVWESPGRPLIGIQMLRGNTITLHVPMARMVRIEKSSDS